MGEASLSCLGDVVSQISWSSAFMTFLEPWVQELDCGCVSWGPVPHSLLFSASWSVVLFRDGLSSSIAMRSLSDEGQGPHLSVDKYLGSVKWFSKVSGSPWDPVTSLAPGGPSVLLVECHSQACLSFSEEGVKLHSLHCFKIGISL